jgi:7,8-dihydropterin-6-yl-methyl-4-(beta-D-ribofuranosyl)aminobenzene 5'-phosphate synthase
MRLRYLAFACACALLAAAAQPLAIRIVYDNTVAEPGMSADWGFAAVVDFEGHRLLFDAGAKPGLFAVNLARLAIEPRSIELIVLSHAHTDHAGGLFQPKAIKDSAPLVLLDAFPQSLAERTAAAGYRNQRTTAPLQLLPGIHTTGLVEGTTPEQALAIDTPRGLVVITGCSHPGVVKMVETARRQRNAETVALLVGGFHLLETPADELEKTAQALQKLNVRRIVPTHCTGEKAIALFRERFGAAAGEGGAGRRLVVE